MATAFVVSRSDAQYAAPADEQSAYNCAKIGHVAKNPPTEKPGEDDDRVIERRDLGGIRMAVGAPRQRILALFLGESAWMVCGGIAVGIPLALGSGIIRMLHRLVVFWEIDTKVQSR